MSKLEYVMLDEAYKPQILEFSCGDVGIDTFFKEEIFLEDIDPEGKGTSTLVLFEDKLVGFYTIKNTSLLFTPDSHLRSIPAIEIIYLAVHKDFQNMGVGSAMLNSVIDKALTISEEFSEIRAIILSSVEDKVDFYLNRGFTDMTEIFKMPYSNCRNITKSLFRLLI